MTLNGKEGAWPMIPDTKMIHSCSFCYVQEIDPQISRVKEVDYDLSSGTVVRYRGSRVLEGALNGCTFFKDILGLLESILVAHGYEQGSASLNFWPKNWLYELFFSDHTGHLETATGKWRCAKGELSGDMQHPRQETFSFLALAYQDDPAAETIPIRPFMHDFRGDGSISWARERIRECESQHHRCTTSNPSLLPSRLLKIVASIDDSVTCVQLHRTTPSKVGITTEKYTALSYCWGGPQDLQLNASSEDTLTSGISPSTLPKTLYDAVQVTWNLGIQWIWIDSLCIRQDDLEEKAREIAQMHSIYGNSFITLSATRASHCSQGFLHQDSLPILATVGYKLPFASPSGKLGTVILSRHRSDSPVDSRGWTLQEHLLARRVLRFTNYQLHWSCRSISMFESENTGTLPSLYVKNLERGYKMYRGIHDEKRDCRHWMNVIEEYTRRELTDGLDKLLAMSGIAESWAQAAKDHYLAGIWESHLPLGLLWSSAQPFRQSEFQAYRAPSWSWASLVGQIDWFDNLFTKVDLTIEVKSCIVNPAQAQALYGAVRSGSLVIYGLLQETLLDEAGVLVGMNEDAECLDLELADVHIDFWDEMLASRVESAKLFCLQICSFDESTGRGPSGLILVTKNGEEFSRVGIFTFEPPQKSDVEEVGDFDELLQLSIDRQVVQKLAFQNITPQTITII